MMIIAGPPGPGTKVGTAWTFQRKRKASIVPRLRSEADGGLREVGGGQGGKERQPGAKKSTWDVRETPPTSALQVYGEAPGLHRQDHCDCGKWGAWK